MALVGLDKTQWLLAANKLGLKTKSIKKDFFRLPYVGLSGIQINNISFRAKETKLCPSIQ
ncbi:hypothetical protein [Photorhabdus caribbeanensis]|uniref:hypothetical protein n=1 Tax=Photorhabdus caribbeanensis TaxID=1004165 RepID=UPI001BD3B2D7|nr:hypothetical protein [Photorhabdus caribbeanensis]